ncbi:MAG: ADYC domain-containing protein [Myxococcota bacterium]|nr:ADYC domain-containing protein [Myxococcota bacterium]
MTRNLLLEMLSSSLLVACAIDDPAVESEAETEQASVSSNGVSLNGVSLNGVSLNGVSLNGVSLNGVSLNGVSLNGVSLNGVSLNGTSLTGTNTSTGQQLTASSVGSILVATLSSGATLKLRIDSASTLAAPNTNVWSYGITYSSDSGWQPLCGDPAVRALQVMGTWAENGTHSASSTNFTFACRGASVAKCVEMGYKTSTTTNHMLACVRLLRGDFCGTGVAYTVTGNAVNLYDSLGIQKDTEAWGAEAEWNPNGARCISQARHTRFYDTGVRPPCVVSGALPMLTGCGTSGFRNSTLIISELPK